MANLGELALAGLGLVLVGGYSSKTQAGEGLGALGSGIASILAAPGTGLGLGLSGTAKGISDLGSAIGDIGAGFGSWFEWINPFDDPQTPTAGNPATQLLPGGGGNVPGPINVINPVETEPGPGQVYHEYEVPRYDPISPTKGLGRIYDIGGGSFGFRKAPGLEFSTRKAARTYLKAYQNDAMDGTSL